MSTLRSIFFLACLSFATTTFAQPTNLVGNLEFSLQKVSDHTWGVFVSPDNTITPSTRTTTGSGQVTLVAPVDFKYSELKNFGGSWVENARVNSPIEAHDMAYISFGFVTDAPKLKFLPATETLLFTFNTTAEFDGTFSLFENGNDPFATPNSFESNPGNDLGVIDYGVAGGLQYYSYANNRSDSAAPAILAKSDSNKTGAKAVFASDRSKEIAAPRNPK